MRRANSNTENTKKNRGTEHIKLILSHTSTIPPSDSSDKIVYETEIQDNN